MLSIVIPTKNEEKFLPLLLQSLKKQTTQDFEVIVADAGSSDQTVKIAQNFGAKIAVGGLPAVGRNNAAKLAQGEILYFFDADVILPEDFLEKTKLELNQKNADFATTLMEPIKNDWKNKISHNLGNLFYFISGPVTPGFCMIVRPALFEKVKFDETLQVMEDLKYAKDAEKLGSFKLLRSVKIKVSDRRMLRDGWVVTLIRTFLIIVSVKLFGFNKRNLFNYQFKDY